MRIADYNVCNNCLRRIDENNRVIITGKKPTKCEYCHKRPKQTKIADPAESYKK